MTFLAALLVATLAIVSCEVTQMMELTPAFYAPQDAKCEDCKKAVSYVLTNNQTIITDICELIPSPLRGECTKLLNEAIQGATADKVCAEVHLCPSSEVSDPDNCKICMDIIGSLFNDSDDVKTLLKEVCSKSGGLESECDLLVELVFDELGHFNATYVCKVMKACPKMLGAERCTWGPGYWCASVDNAKECGTFELCSEKYWV